MSFEIKFAQCSSSVVYLVLLVAAIQKGLKNYRNNPLCFLNISQEKYFVGILDASAKCALKDVVILGTLQGIPKTGAIVIYVPFR